MPLQSSRLWTGQIRHPDRGRRRGVWERSDAHGLRRDEVVQGARDPRGVQEVRDTGSRIDDP